MFVNEVLNVQSGERTVPCALGKIAVRLYSPERVVLGVEVPGTRKAVLASTERYAAGWKARVDDAPAEVFRVNLYFCIFRRNPATIPRPNRPLFRRESGHPSEGNSAGVPSRFRPLFQGGSELIRTVPD